MLSTGTRERILDQGLALMSQTGLSGVTLGVLADQVGMSKSGLFAHFKSKEEVQIGLLEHSLRVGEIQIVQPTMKAPPGLPRVRALAAHWFGWTRRAGLPGGCPVAAAMFELDDVDSPVREWVRAQESKWRAFLRQLVDEATERGHFRKNLDPEQFVWELSGIYLAHHAAYRFVRSPDADERASAALEALIERSLPATPSGFGRKRRRPRQPSIIKA